MTETWHRGRQGLTGIYLLIILLPSVLLFSGCRDSKFTNGWWGAERCGGCHKENFADWKKSGHASAMNIVYNGTTRTYPFTTIPRPPSAFAWKEVSWVIGGYNWKTNFLDCSGFIVTGVGTQYDFACGTWSSYEALTPYPPGMPFDCGRCHTSGWEASNTAHHQGLGGILGTWHEDGVSCEECHKEG